MKYLATLAALFLSAPALAQDLSGGGFIDLRVTANSRQIADLRGGLGKLRYGGTGSGGESDAQFAQALAYGNLLLTEDLLVYADVKLSPRQRTTLDMNEAFIRYRPVSTTAWRFSLKAGAFFPPVSLENTGPGWTSPWTLTPSAVNSWVGEELRTIGAEAKAEWRGEADRISALAALFARNDAAGVMLADDGWRLTDRVTGLLDRLRLPNIVGGKTNTAPVWREPFTEIDGRPGFYGGLDWRHEGWGEAHVIAYENQADAHAFDREYAWRTEFIGVGLRSDIDGWTFLGQAMTGRTAVNFDGDEPYTTDFQAAYLLAGYRYEDWRLAARFDSFATEAPQGASVWRLSEHGHAETMALTWSASEHIKLVTEGIWLDSWRLQRVPAKSRPERIDRQLQTSLRISF